MKIKTEYVKNTIFPGFIYSAVTGIITGAVIFLFKISANKVIKLSELIYGFSRNNPQYAIFLLLGATVLGGLSAITVKQLGNCKGGGIPTSIAIISDLIEFKWLSNIVVVFVSTLLSFLGGVPLGNEGPSVQMGTAVGRGVSKAFGRNHPAWDRYIMTGGAASGFACATGAPITGIFFALEETHRRFSSMLFMSAAWAVISASLTMRVLCRIAGISPSLFDFTLSNILPTKYVFGAAFVGIVCGLAAVLFTFLYKKIGRLIREGLRFLSPAVKITLVFVLVAVMGFFFKQSVGTGHNLIELLFHGEFTLSASLFYLCVRVILLIIATNSGITGGLFVPTLAFGAMIGSVCAKLLINTGLLPNQFYSLITVIGISAFLAASSHIPISAIIFSLEALSGINNIIPIVMGVAFSYITAEVLGEKSFVESVIESKVKYQNEGKKPKYLVASFKVQKGSFAEGKELNEILWPAYSVVTRLEKDKSYSEETLIEEGDLLHIHSKSYSVPTTVNKLEALIGRQDDDIKMTVSDLDE